MRLHVVTQWKSLTSSACGNARNSSQLTENGLSHSPPTSSRQSASATLGESPRSSTGQFGTCRWPVGNLGMP